MEIIEEQNPLHITIKPNYSKHPTSTNCAGRPKKGTEIKFGPQPKSVVSQLLRAERAIRESKQAGKCDNDRDFSESSDESEPKKKLKSPEVKVHHCEYQTCTYTTKSSSNMIKHKRRHTSEKPYMCDQCTFRTNFINSLTVHKRIHSGERPFICEHCSYRCNSSSNLKKHHMHKHSGIT